MKKNILRPRNSNINYMEKSLWKSNVHVEISFLEAEKNSSNHGRTILGMTGNNLHILIKWYSV